MRRITPVPAVHRGRTGLLFSYLTITMGGVGRPSAHWRGRHCIRHRHRQRDQQRYRLRHDRFHDVEKPPRRAPTPTPSPARVTSDGYRQSHQAAIEAAHLSRSGLTSSALEEAGWAA